MSATRPDARWREVRERPRRRGSNVDVSKPPIRGAILLGSITIAGLGWGVAIAALSSFPHKTATTPTVASAEINELSTELQARDYELSQVALAYRHVALELGAARRSLRDRPASPVQQPIVSTAQAAEIQTERDQLIAQTNTVAQLRQEVADLKSDNAGFEVNYNDLLRSLHRTQNEVFIDRRRLAARTKCHK